MFNLKYTYYGPNLPITFKMEIQVHFPVGRVLLKLHIEQERLARFIRSDNSLLLLLYVDSNYIYYIETV